MKHTTMKTILAALCTAAGAGLSTCAALPAEYTAVEYIQPNGQCRIKTGVTPAWNDKTEMVWTPSTVSGNQALWCSRTNTLQSFTVYMIGNKVRLDRNSKTPSSATILSAGTRYSIAADYGAGTAVVTNDVSGAELAFISAGETTSYTPGSELELFASHTWPIDGGVENYGSYRLYSFKLRAADDTLRLDLAPAKRVADGEAGLYDFVSGTFMTNVNVHVGSFSAGIAAAANSYTWIGGASGNLSTAANWSPAPAGAFTAADELIVTNAAEITVDAVTTIGRLALNSEGGMQFIASGGNTLTLERIIQNGAGEATFACPVQFAGTYIVDASSAGGTGGAVKFPGGATATRPDDGIMRTAYSTAASRTLDGTFTFTADWIVNNMGDYPWIVASNSVVRGQNFSGTQVSRHRILRVEETGSAYFTTVTNGWDKGDIDIDGYLEVSGEIIVITSPSGGSSGYSRFGRSGNVGTAKAPRIAKTEHGACQCYIPNLIVGAGGLGALTKDYYWEFDVDATVTATDSFEILGLFRSGNSYDWGLRLNGHQLTINVPENMTVTYGVAESGTGGSIRKTGAGTLVMTDTYNGDSGYVKQYAGGTVIEEGKVVFAANGQLGTGPVTLGANGTLEIAAGITFSNPIEGSGSLSVAGDITMLDGARLIAGTSTFASGTKVVVENQTTQGVIATGVSRADFDACFETANGELSWSDGSVSYGNSYVWIGAEGGKWSNAANWSYNGAVATQPPLNDTYADVLFTNAATVVFDVPATIQDLYISGAGAVKIENPSAYGSEIQHELTLATVTSSASVMPVLDCRVVFAGTYKVSFTNKAVNFAGGAVATTWDSGNTVASPTSDFYGNITFTADWTLPSVTGDRCYVRDGATLTCPSLILPLRNASYNQLAMLQIDAGGTLNCRTVEHNGSTTYYNGVGDGVVVYVNGTLNVTDKYNMNMCGRIGIFKQQGNSAYQATGVMNVNGIVANSTTTSPKWIEQRKINLGAEGILVKAADVTGIGIGPQITIGALADYEIRYEGTGSKVHFHAPVTFDTYDAAAAVARTVTISADVEDGTTIGTYSGGRYNLGGAITKNNAGTLIVSGNNTFTGGVTVNGGTVRLEHDNAAGTGAITVAAGATLELADGVTITNTVTFADGATLVCGTGSQISGPVTRNGTVNLCLTGSTTIFPAGYTDTTGFTVTPDSAVGTLSVDGGALKYDARAVGTYTWTGAVDGNFSTPGNWSVNDAATQDIPGVQDTIRFVASAATTVTLDADAQVAAMVIEGSKTFTLTNPGSTTNTLTLTSVTSSATVMPVINCRVQFTDKYTVSFTSKAVKFAGGATATTWDLSNTALSPTSELTGNITFTGTLTAPSAQADRLYVMGGSVVNCAAVVLPYCSNNYKATAHFIVKNDGVLNCGSVTQNGLSANFNNVANCVMLYTETRGVINVTGNFTQTRGGRVGIWKCGGALRVYSYGVLNMDGLVVNNTSGNEWLSFEQQKANIGPGGIVVKSTDKFAKGIIFAPWVRLGAYADYEISSEKSDPIIRLYQDLTFDTLDSVDGVTPRTILVSANVHDEKTRNNDYQYGYNFAGGYIIKENPGTLILSGDNTYSLGTTVNGGTLLAAHDHALGTGAASVAAGGTLELMEGVSVTNAVTLAADATLLIDGAEARTAAGTSVVGAIATPSTGTATLKVTGDLSEETQNISIMLGALAEGASVEALTLDATELTLPKAGWRARLKAREGAFMLDVKKPTGMTLIVR